MTIVGAWESWCRGFKARHNWKMEAVRSGVDSELEFSLGSVRTSKLSSQQPHSICFPEALHTFSVSTPASKVLILSISVCRRCHVWEERGGYLRGAFRERWHGYLVLFEDGFRTKGRCWKRFSNFLIGTGEGSVNSSRHYWVSAIARGPLLSSVAQPFSGLSEVRGSQEPSSCS